MSPHSNDRPITPLRRRMLEDMAVRGLREATQRDYIRFVQTFAAFLGRSPERATADDLRRFQVHQAQTGVQPPRINCSVSALRFLFTVTLDRQDLSRRLVLARYPRKLPEVLSVEEVGRLLQAAPGAKYRAALGTAYGMAAVVAVFDMATEGCGATGFDRRHHLQFAKAQMSEAGRLEGGACDAENVGEFDPGSQRLSRVRHLDFRTGQAGRAD